MAKYILKRLLYAVPTLFIISILIFGTIQLPPGDFVSNMMEQMRNQSGVTWSPQFAESMRERYGLNEPMPTQYLKWIGNIILHGDFGYSFQNSEPAEKMISDRMGMTLVLFRPVLFLHGWWRCRLGCFRRPAVQPCRLRFQLHWLHRTGDPGLPDRAGVDVRGVQIGRRDGQRVVLQPSSRTPRGASPK